MNDLDRKLARGIANLVLSQASPDDPDAAERVEFADTLLARVEKEEDDERQGS